MNTPQNKPKSQSGNKGCVVVAGIFILSLFAIGQWDENRKAAEKEAQQAATEKAQLQLQKKIQSDPVLRAQHAKQVAQQRAQQAAEAKRKSDARRAQVKATALAEKNKEKNLKKEMSAFMHAIQLGDPTGSLIEGVEIRRENQLIIDVTNSWFEQSYHDRLDLANAMQKIWMSVHNPKAKSLADANIRINDHQGNKVGGSDVIWGVWVDKD